jgi:acetyl esterase/lipase
MKKASGVAKSSVLTLRGYKLDRITAPTMVLHGANDTNVPVIEAEQIVSTLKKRGIPVEYVLFPDEGHGWRKVNSRIRSTVEITQFFSVQRPQARSGTGLVLQRRSFECCPVTSRTEAPLPVW